MYLLLNGYKIFIFINRAFHKDSFKIKMFVLFLFLDKVVNCSDLFSPCRLGMSEGNPHKCVYFIVSKFHCSPPCSWFFFKTKGE